MNNKFDFYSVLQPDMLKSSASKHGRRLSKSELFVRLFRLRSLIVDDLDTIRDSIRPGSMEAIWYKTFIDMLKSAMLMKLNEYNLNYCNNDEFVGDCRFALLCCYKNIMAGIREAAFRYALH